RDPHLEAALDDAPRQPLGVRRSAVQVDVAAVGMHADEAGVETQVGENLGRDRGGGAVGAVHRNLHPRATGRRRQDLDQVPFVLLAVVHRRHGGGVGRHAPGRVVHHRLDLPLEHFGELLARAREHFDAVVAKRVVRRRDHHAGGEALTRCQVSDRGRRHHAGTDERGPLAHHARGQFLLDPGSRLAGVAPGEKAQRPADPIRRAVVAQHAHQRRAETADGGGIERVGAGFAAHAIGTKQTGHGSFHSVPRRAIVTVTRTASAERRCTAGSATPTLTTSVTVDAAPATDTGSVIASLVARTAVVGPDTITIAGSDVTCRTSKPAAGSPSTTGDTATCLLADGSNVMDRLDGVTTTTSTPNGARTSPLLKWNSRGPALACRRSRIATSSPAVNRPSAPAEPRTRTSTSDGASVASSSPAGRFENSSG